MDGFEVTEPDLRLITVKKIFYFSLILISSFFSGSSANDAWGCNGFIKSEVGSIDFSKIDVKLFTKQGSLKDKTECAPNNGYYFLPLYDKGDYVLRVEPPVGWHFEPSEVAINVDGTTDSCSLDADVNFVLKGFAITGQVLSLGETKGPKGVIVNMMSLSSPTDVLLSTTTIESGVFILTPVIPGQYIVEIWHDRWQLSKKRVAVNVKIGNEKISEGSLVVSGYDVSGSVTSDGEPIHAVSFVLFQSVHAKRAAVTGCDTTALSGFSPTGLNLKDLVPICHVVSDTKGSFTFTGVPPGQYIIIPHYKSTHSIKFDVQPQQLQFHVQHGSLELPTVFQVKGFSVEGQVLWGVKGKPLEGATVLLNQKVVTQTGKDGGFHLDNMTPGIYKLLIQARDVLFEEKSVKVTANTPDIGSLVPSQYNVCGKISSSDREVHFLHSDTGEIHHAVSDSQGQYCIYLPPATYSVSLPVSEAERESGLQFAPLKRRLVVLDSPVTGVDFSQLQATIKGVVKCLSATCPEIVVTLQANDIATNTLISTGGMYKFENVLPGEYKMSVSKDDYCWKTSEFPLTVATEQVQGPSFQQTGIPIHFVSSHSTKVKYSMEDKGNVTKSGEFEVTAGHSSVCVLPGVYMLEPTGCHGYAKSTTRWVGGLVTLTAVSHRYTGHVLSSHSVSDMIISVIPSDDTTSTQSSSSAQRLVAVKDTDKEGRKVYTFSLQLTPGETVTLVPAASSLLFSPTSAVAVGADDCVTGVQFQAEKGKDIMESRLTCIVETPRRNTEVKFSTGTFLLCLDKDPSRVENLTSLFFLGVSTIQVLEGRVLGNNLPVSGATVTILDDQGAVIATQVTDSEGRYIFGPLSANNKYNVTAEKEGYVLSGPNSKGEFSAHKLAEVIVTVRDKADEQPLQGVLLSLSGGEKYRRNSQTGEDGKMAFLSLSPSQYYLRPMMKEYRFDPPSKMIQVQEGATVEVALSGERVAYSLVGSVTSLSGEGEPGVVVEAVGQGSDPCTLLQEESTTEANGYFRIRGLQPQCDYSVRVKQGTQINQHIQRSTPEHINVKVIKDVQGLNIIVFRPISRTDISVYVTADNSEFLRSLRVKMSRDDTMVHSVRLSSLKPTPTFALNSAALVFPPVPADGRMYSIQLESSLSQKTHQYRTHPVYFKANSSFQLVKLNFSPTTQASDGELSHTSYLALPMFVIALLAIYHRETVSRIFTALPMYISRTSDNSSFSDSSDGLTVDQTNTKKKMKIRKT